MHPRQLPSPTWAHLAERPLSGGGSLSLGAAGSEPVDTPPESAERLRLLIKDEVGCSVEVNLKKDTKMGKAMEAFAKQKEGVVKDFQFTVDGVRLSGMRLRRR
jgi:hypothetical protein